MKVILLKSVPNVGQAGEVKELADGYARNYLVPNGLAVSATPQKLVEIRVWAVKRARLTSGSKYDFRQAYNELDGRHFEFRAKANERGTLFARVTAKSISDMLKAKEYEVQPAMIELSQPLKHIGDHKVVIDFGGQKKAVIVLEIKAEV